MASIDLAAAYNRATGASLSHLDIDEMAFGDVELLIAALKIRNIEELWQQ